MENPVEKRILEEYDEIESNPSDDFKFLKVDRNSFEWQGALRGPSGTEFEGGIYHVVLRFPMGYPWKKPSFIFLTENGSFSINTKTNARLNWDPSRRVRQAFLELIDLMPECPDFKSDSEEHKEKRRDLAKKSREAATKYGSGEHQKLTDEIHQYMQRDVPQLQQTRNTSLTQRCEEEVVVDRSVIVEDKCNIKNSLEKRILEEYNEIESNPTYDFTCLTRWWNKYEWQYAIRGPSGTEFEDGIYHGIVQFSKGYPSKPPLILFLTENGCFETQTSPSLELLSYWQPSWSVKNFLVAVIEEMLTYSVENKREARRQMAIDSRAAAPKYGSVERQKLIAEIHEYLLSKSSVPELSPVTSHASNGTGGSCVVNIIFQIICWNTFKNICGNIFDVSDANHVGVFDSLNEFPYLKHFLVFMFFVGAFGVWSYKE